MASQGPKYHFFNNPSVHGAGRMSPQSILKRRTTDQVLDTSDIALGNIGDTKAGALVIRVDIATAPDSIGGEGDLLSLRQVAGQSHTQLVADAGGHGRLAEYSHPFGGDVDHTPQNFLAALLVNRGVED